MQSLSILRFAGLLGLVLALGACEGVKKQFGLNKQSPDEFKVVARAPLTLPPDFTLRPPDPGAPRPQEGTAADQARKAVFRATQNGVPAADAAAAQPGSVSSGPSAGERSLLKSAGATDIDPQIRALVNREAQELREDQGFMESLVFWRDKQDPGTVVDADAEARRLRENAALGKNVTEGETPSIERRRRGLFENIF
jgi:hypothetical protein